MKDMTGKFRCDDCGAAPGTPHTCDCSRPGYRIRSAELYSEDEALFAIKFMNSETFQK